MWENGNQKRSALAHCSFCRKSQDQVGHLTAGPGDVFICNECVDLYRKHIEERAGEALPMKTITQVCGSCGIRVPVSHHYCYNCGSPFPPLSD